MPLRHALSSILVAVATVAVSAAGPAGAAAQTAGVLDDPAFQQLLPPVSAPLAAAGGEGAPQVQPGAGRPGARSAAQSDPVRQAILRAARKDAISSAESLRYRKIWRNARRTARTLKGARGRELASVLGTVRLITARKALHGHRMPAVFETVRRNRAFWTERAFPKTSQRVSFKGSRVIWQYYPGRGMQFQPLASFGRANALWSRHDAAGREGLGELLDELSALRSVRGGAVTWEYYFPFGGGQAPWTSAISQGTAIQALARGGRTLDRPELLELARAALPLFAKRTPVGVRVPVGRDGNWYALYSFAPGLRVLNAHVQALNGLNDLAVHGSSDQARRLYQEGERAARRRITQFDTGAWSLYASPGREATLNYHQLNTDVLSGLCRRSKRAAICDASRRFTRYRTEAPLLTRVRTGRPIEGRSTGVNFTLSKVGTVQVYVKRRAGARVLRRVGAPLTRGRRRLTFRAPTTPGRYRIDIRATDLAGNVGREAVHFDVRESARTKARRATARERAERRAAQRRKRARERREARERTEPTKPTSTVRGG
ncbi:MAG: D-glucuronyl C5-epimerase family protein [Solirubrobacterales bacterium]